MKPKTKIPRSPLQRKVQNATVPTYEELLQQNKNLYKIIKDLQNCMEEIIHIQNQRQKNPIKKKKKKLKRKNNGHNRRG